MYACFSEDSIHVYAFSNMKNLYVFDKQTSKLASLIVVPIEKAEITAMMVAFDNYSRKETLAMYNLNNLFKLSS